MRGAMLVLGMKSEKLKNKITQTERPMCGNDLSAPGAYMPRSRPR